MKTGIQFSYKSNLYPVKPQFYFSKKSIQFIRSAATFFCTSQINTQKSLTPINDLSASRSLEVEATPVKHKHELLFLSVPEGARMLPVANELDDFSIVSFGRYINLIESQLVLRIKISFYQINIIMTSLNNVRQ